MTTPQDLNPVGAPVTAEELAAKAAADPMTQELLASGATATQVDAVEMMNQIKQLQARLAQLEAERGVPSDPIAGALQNLKDHVNARAAQYPLHDFTEVKNLLDSLPTDSEALTTAHTGLTQLTVNEFTDVLKHLEIGYLKELASALHKHVLKRDVEPSNG